MKKNTQIKKLRGYQKAPRDRFLLLRDKKLTQEEFLVYEVGIDLTDWDGRHTETYGTFQATNREIAEILGWKSDSTVSRYRASLIKKGYFRLTPSSRLKALDFDKRQLRKPANMQITRAEMQEEVAKMQTTSANIEENRSENSVYSLVSSKGSVSLRTDEEYQAIKEEMGYKELTVEDMKWIDQNVKENPNVPS